MLIESAVKSFLDRNLMNNKDVVICMREIPEFGIAVDAQEARERSVRAQRKGQAEKKAQSKKNRNKA